MSSEKMIDEAATQTEKGVSVARMSELSGRRFLDLDEVD